MTVREMRTFLLVAAVVLVVTIVLALLFSPEPKSSVSDAGTILTVITLVSVGIERVLELFWTYIGLTKGTWWPLNTFDKEIKALVFNLDQTLDPFYTQLQKIIDDAENAVDVTNEQYEAVKQEVADFKGFIDQLKTLPPGNQQAQTIANVASQLIDSFQQRYTTLDGIGTIADKSIAIFAETLGASSDNLGRRFISLFAGMFLGLVVAGVFGLDLVQAVFQSSLSGQGLHLGIVLTGLVIGLGSNPTHEAIRVLQEWKTRLKTQTTTT